jgi:hypothetical protein
MQGLEGLNLIQAEGPKNGVLVGAVGQPFDLLLCSQQVSCQSLQHGKEKAVYCADPMHLRPENCENEVKTCEKSQEKHMSWVLPQRGGSIHSRSPLSTLLRSLPHLLASSIKPSSPVHPDTPNQHSLPSVEADDIAGDCCRPLRRPPWDQSTCVPVVHIVLRPQLIRN